MNDARFTLEDIQGFVAAQGNLVEASEGGESLDLLYLFPDGRPAIGFTEISEGVYEREFLSEEIEEQWFGHFL